MIVTIEIKRISSNSKLREIGPDIKALPLGVALQLRNDIVITLGLVPENDAASEVQVGAVVEDCKKRASESRLRCCEVIRSAQDGYPPSPDFRSTNQTCQRLYIRRCPGGVV